MSPLLTAPQPTTFDRDLLDRVLAIANGKGGVGKTSITVNLAGLLAAAGYYVLLIDWDSQANVSDDLGLTAAGTDDGEAAFNAITTGRPLEPIKDVRPRLDVVTAGDFTDDLADVLTARKGRRPDHEVLGSLAASLAPIAGKYDIVLIDCPPKSQILQELALVAARYLLIPTKSDASSRKGMRKIGERFVVAQQYNPTLELLGAVLFGSGQAATTVRNQARAEISADLGTDTVLFDTTIRHVEKTAKQARDSGRLVHELEQVAAEQKRTRKRWFEVHRENKDRAAHGLEPLPVEDDSALVAQSVTGLAEDYQKLSEELLDRIAAHTNATAADDDEETSR